MTVSIHEGTLERQSDASRPRLWQQAIQNRYKHSTQLTFSTGAERHMYLSRNTRNRPKKMSCPTNHPLPYLLKPMNHMNISHSSLSWFLSLLLLLITLSDRNGQNCMLKCVNISNLCYRTCNHFNIMNQNLFLIDIRKFHSAMRSYKDIRKCLNHECILC